MNEELKEVTNAVLGEQINGLTKLTDERFLNLKESLARIELNSNSYATKQELEENKKDFNKTIIDIRNGFSQHNEEDKKSFSGLSQQMSFLTRTILLGMGGLGTIVFFLQVILPYFVKK